MHDRDVNVALLVLGLAAFASGWLSFAIGTPPGRWVVASHGLLGLAVLALAPLKAAIVHRGLRRPRRGRTAAVALTAAALIAVAAGLLLPAGVDRIGPLTTMQVHVGAGVATVLLLAAHRRRRPPGPAPVDPARRRLVRFAALGGAAALLWGGWESTAALTRRFTGSHERGSFDPPGMPVTQWFDDRVPDVDAGAWRMTVDGRQLGIADLAVVDEVRAVLDCTGGWHAEQIWGGTRLDRLLSPPEGTRSVVVRSVTGYARRFPVRDLDRLWVATAVGGDPLLPGHGRPARLVAPGRRGFWWVKWIDAIESSPLPWWVQSPFPLT